MFETYVIWSKVPRLQQRQSLGHLWGSPQHDKQQWNSFKNHISDTYVPCKTVASSSALASASKGAKGSGRRLLRAVMADPKWSCMITPIPVMPRWEKTATSTLTFYHGNVGGTQRPSMVSLTGWAKLIIELISPQLSLSNSLQNKTCALP